MNLNELRAEVAKRQKAANAKIARLRRKGVQVADSEFDVRREPSRVARYNSKQLQSYLGDLNSFTNRRNQFVAGAEGVPIRAHKYNHAMRTAREYNSFVEDYYFNVAGTNIPQQGMTVADFDRDVRADRRRGKGGVSRPLSVEQRQAFEFANEKGLTTWRDNLEQKMRPGYLAGKLKYQRSQMMDAIGNYGDEKLTELAKSLDDEQFDTLWNYTDAPRQIFEGYHYAKLLSTGNAADETDANIHEDASEETRQWLTWAATLPPRGNGKKRK